MSVRCQRLRARQAHKWGLDRTLLSPGVAIATSDLVEEYLWWHGALPRGIVAPAMGDVMRVNSARVPAASTDREEGDASGHLRLPKRVGANANSMLALIDPANVAASDRNGEPVWGDIVFEHDAIV
jgi:hypothetical protein